MSHERGHSEHEELELPHCVKITGKALTRAYGRIGTMCDVWLFNESVNSTSMSPKPFGWLVGRSRSAARQMRSDCLEHWRRRSARKPRVVSRVGSTSAARITWRFGSTPSRTLLWSPPADPPRPTADPPRPIPVSAPRSRKPKTDPYGGLQEARRRARRVGLAAYRTFLWSNRLFQPAITSMPAGPCPRPAASGHEHEYGAQALSEYPAGGRFTAGASASVGW